MRIVGCYETGREKSENMNEARGEDDVFDNKITAVSAALRLKILTSAGTAGYQMSASTYSEALESRTRKNELKKAFDLVT